MTSHLDTLDDDDEEEAPVLETLTPVVPMEQEAATSALELDHITQQQITDTIESVIRSTCVVNGLNRGRKRSKRKGVLSDGEEYDEGEEDGEDEAKTDLDESLEDDYMEAIDAATKSSSKPKKEVRTKESRCYIQQRSYIQQAAREGKQSSGDVHRMLKSIYGEMAISRAQSHNWFKMFKEGRTMVQDSARSGRPPTSRTNAKVAAMKATIKDNRRISIRNLATLQSISFGSVYEIISKDLKLRRVADQFVPTNLSEDQRDYRLSMCRDLLAHFEKDPLFVSKVVIAAETYVFSIPNKKYLAANTGTEPFYVKSMLVLFFDMNGLIHYEFVPPESTPIDASYYVSVLVRLYQAMFAKRSERWNSWDWMLMQEYSWPHNSLPVLEFLTKNNIIAMPVAPNSPDLSPFDSILYQKLKYHFAGKLFNSSESICEHAEKVLNQISWRDYQKCFKQWPELWRQCIRSGGDYFEKDTTGKQGTEANVDKMTEPLETNGSENGNDPLFPALTDAKSLDGNT